MSITAINIYNAYGGSSSNSQTLDMTGATAGNKAVAIMYAKNAAVAPETGPVGWDEANSYYADAGGDQILAVYTRTLTGTSADDFSVGFPSGKKTAIHAIEMSSDVDLTSIITSDPIVINLGDPDTTASLSTPADSTGTIFYAYFVRANQSWVETNGDTSTLTYTGMTSYSLNVLDDGTSNAPIIIIGTEDFTNGPSSSSETSTLSTSKYAGHSMALAFAFVEASAPEPTTLTATRYENAPQVYQPSVTKEQTTKIIIVG